MAVGCTSRWRAYFAYFMGLTAALRAPMGFQPTCGESLGALCRVRWGTQSQKLSAYAGKTEGAEHMAWQLLLLPCD